MFEVLNEKQVSTQFIVKGHYII